MRLTEAQIAANNAAVLAARNAAEQELRKRLAPTGGTVLVRRSVGGRPRGKRNWEDFDPDEPRKIYVKARTAKAISDKAREDGVTVSLLVEVMVDSYLTAPAEHRMLAEMLHAVKRYEKENATAKRRKRR